MMKSLTLVSVILFVGCGSNKTPNQITPTVKDTSTKTTATTSNEKISSGTAGTSAQGQVQSQDQRGAPGSGPQQEERGPLPSFQALAACLDTNKDSLLSASEWAAQETKQSEFASCMQQQEQK